MVTLCLKIKAFFPKKRLNHLREVQALFLVQFMSICNAEKKRKFLPFLSNLKAYYLQSRSVAIIIIERNFHCIHGGNELLIR